MKWFLLVLCCFNLGPPSCKDVCFYLTVMPQVDYQVEKGDMIACIVFKIKLILDKSCFFFFKEVISP